MWDEYNLANYFLPGISMLINNAMPEMFNNKPLSDTAVYTVIKERPFFLFS